DAGGSVEVDPSVEMDHSVDAPAKKWTLEGPAESENDRFRLVFFENQKARDGNRIDARTDWLAHTPMVAYTAVAGDELDHVAASLFEQINGLHGYRATVDYHATVNDPAVDGVKMTVPQITVFSDDPSQDMNVSVTGPLDPIQVDNETEGRATITLSGEVSENDRWQVTIEHDLTSSLQTAVNDVVYQIKVDVVGEAVYDLTGVPVHIDEFKLHNPVVTYEVLDEDDSLSIVASGLAEQLNALRGYEAFADGKDVTIYSVDVTEMVDIREQVTEPGSISIKENDGTAGEATLTLSGDVAVGQQWNVWILVQPKDIQTGTTVTYDILEIDPKDPTQGQRQEIWFGGFETGNIQLNVPPSLTSEDNGAALGNVDASVGSLRYLQDLYLATGAGADNIFLNTTLPGRTTINAGAGADEINVEQIAGITTIEGGAGDDVLRANYDRSGRPTFRNGLGFLLPPNKSYHLNLMGGTGSDSFVVGLAGQATSARIRILDEVSDDQGVNDLTIYGTPRDDAFLSRAGRGLGSVSTFEIDPATGLPAEDADVQRVDYDTTLSGALIVDAGAGNDQFVFDDNRMSMTVYGRAGDDTFQMGQLYRSPRNQFASGLEILDWFETTQTTRGFLSNGISFASTMYGGDGDDIFNVYRNTAELTLFGEIDDDSFRVRAFVIV
ncbi:MAG: hypothetical protein MK179_22865, partial [Pirellulaceae bacterium]|nr:hypothetical protein [Pirellulaceae bacterium]